MTSLSPMSFLDHITRCNQFNPQDAVLFWVGRQPIGWIQRTHIAVLQSFPDYFQVSEDRVELHPSLTTYDQRTAAMATVVAYLKAQGRLSQWRGELYDIAPAYRETPLFALERGATAFFGVPSYGTHLNGFTYRHGQLYIWIARRSEKLVVAPGLLDNVAAGGLPKGITPLQNIIKESWEEARLPKSLVQNAIPHGQISYLMATAQGVTPDCMFTFDLELPPTIVPQADGQEVDQFSCLPADEVYHLVKNTQTFKYNSALVVIAFLIRHQIITPAEPDYQALKTQLQCSFFPIR